MSQLNWYEQALAIDVKDDICKNPDIFRQCRPYYKKFVRFASIQRVSYQNDINAEWQEFQDKYINQRIYNVDVNLWKRISKSVFERDHYTCLYCGAVGGKLEVDHMIPISRGGTNVMANLATSCRHCNRQKHDKTVDEYLKWREDHE